MFFYFKLSDTVSSITASFQRVKSLEEGERERGGESERGREVEGLRERGKTHRYNAEKV